ncbi:hypothetical protein PENTCL1PPCAC_21998, partial [Pristionchus entomophagus]
SNLPTVCKNFSFTGVTLLLNTLGECWPRMELWKSSILAHDANRLDMLVGGFIDQLLALEVLLFDDYCAMHDGVEMMSLHCRDYIVASIIQDGMMNADGRYQNVFEYLPVVKE